jgi:glutaredoxin 3
VARVDVYGTVVCPYCVRAKRLLEARGIPYEEHDVGADPDLRDEIVRRSGRRTVPQIFIDDRPIGGFEELAALDSSGTLAGLVAQVDDAE